MEIIKLREEFIKLGQALKAAGLVESGVEAKEVIQDGLVKSMEKSTQEEERNFMMATSYLLMEQI